jgi:hypothetical protein
MLDCGISRVGSIQDLVYSQCIADQVIWILLNWFQKLESARDAVARLSYVLYAESPAFYLVTPFEKDCKSSD